MSGNIHELRRNQEGGGSEEDLDVAGDPDVTLYSYAFQDFESGRPNQNSIQPGSSDGPGTSNVFSFEASLYELSRRSFDLNDYFNDDAEQRVDFRLGRGLHGHGMQNRRGIRRRVCTLRRDRRRVVSSQPELLARDYLEDEPVNQPPSKPQAEGSEEPQGSQDKKLVESNGCHTCGTVPQPPPPPSPPSGKV